MSYDSWKLQNDHDSDARAVHLPLELEPGEREAEEEHAQNIENLLETAREAHALMPADDDIMNGHFKNDLQNWLARADLYALTDVRRRIDEAMARLLAGALPRATKTRKDKGKPNPNNRRVKPRPEAKEPQP